MLLNLLCVAHAFSSSHITLLYNLVHACATVSPYHLQLCYQWQREGNRSIIIGNHNDKSVQRIHLVTRGHLNSLNSDQSRVGQTELSPFIQILIMLLTCNPEECSAEHVLANAHQNSLNL